MIVILCGKSGTGKDYLLKRLVWSDGYIPVVSYTTRPMRPDEVNGVDYQFVSRETFYHLMENGYLVESRSYDTLVNGNNDTWYYGTPKVGFKTSLDYVLILDLEGAKIFKKYCEEENQRCVVIFIDASDEIREKRAIERGGFDKSEWNRRLKDDTEKFSYKKVYELTRWVLRNDKSKDYLYRSYKILLEQINNSNL